MIRPCRACSNFTNLRNFKDLRNFRAFSKEFENLIVRALFASNLPFSSILIIIKVITCARDSVLNCRNVLVFLINVTFVDGCKV